MYGIQYGMIVFTDIMFIVAVIALILGAKLYMQSTIVLKMANKKADRIKQCAKLETDKIASMGLVELTEYLSDTFAKIIELTSAESVSERDPYAVETLYAATLVNFTNHLSSNYEAIEYYYGKGFIINWFSLHYKLLELHGNVSQIVQKTKTDRMIKIDLA